MIRRMATANAQFFRSYSPLSSLNIKVFSKFYKAFEKVLCSRMKDFIEKHDVPYSTQYGFRKIRATPHEY